MSNEYLSMDNLRFMLFDLLDTEKLLEFERFRDYDKESLDIILDSFKDFGDQECYPYLKEMDEKPVYFKDGQVYVHPQIDKMMKKGGELGLIGATFSQENGGLQLPGIITQAAYFILDAANNHMSGYPGLTAGAAGLIASFANQELKDKYLPDMLSGNWGGTMCLTEPHAGSSLSDITTTAYPTEEGHYRIEGQKIWISGGDQQFADNIIHLLLARIDGAPAGTKGISLFVVPKKRINEDGSTESNGVVSAGDFQKLGQRGYSSVHLVFGDGEECRGWLVGEPHKGLRYMFQMMNGARIAVGRHGSSVATAAYYASLKYAKERPQGRRLTNNGRKDLSEGQTLIINHADVRRMLFFQKAVAEGTLSLVLLAAYYHDRETVATTEEEKIHYNNLLEILTPIVKTYPSEMGRLSVSTGLQVLGGMGFSREHILQQYYRDIRIMSIYEGTTGIQSMDLLGRKVTMHGGDAIRLLTKEIMATVGESAGHESLKPYGEILAATLRQNQEVLEFLIPFAMKGNHERFLSDATIYMELLGTIVMGWQWLMIANRAQKALLDGETKYTKTFYEGKIHTMKFFFKYEIPKIDGWVKTIKSSDVLTIVMQDVEYLD